ncbi:amidohydrolase family protein [Rhizobium sp. KVB221]|uniref:Amidohydrolase family protein n=1 Tax=Rhizobium setariae TaxID=2801340 RepID=A0A936YUB1_9HYPH|nr:amidohydrolase family protein [Rhizobium setariae]MBL0373306.1 amidohydrolase family protein [Rhizobium setariae]
MDNALYSGPIIDAHHHLWDFDQGKHPWLAGPQGDELQPLRHAFLPADYLTVASGSNVVATVHIEAGWDPVDPVSETAWLETLEKPGGIASRYVAHAPLHDPQAPELLQQHAAYQRVTGIRDILTWHPDPAKRRVADEFRMEDPVWRRNFGLLARHGMSFDLMISPWQMQAARRLAEDFPEITIVLNHCGSPMDRTPEGMERWRSGLRNLAKTSNVHIKLSNPTAYDPDWTAESLTNVLKHGIDCFGPERVLFATDYPVLTLQIGFAAWIDVFKTAVRSYSAEEQRRMFHDNANAVYRMGLPLR